VISNEVWAKKVVEDFVRINQARDRTQQFRGQDFMTKVRQLREEALALPAPQPGERYLDVVILSSFRLAIKLDHGQQGGELREGWLHCSSPWDREATWKMATTFSSEARAAALASEGMVAFSQSRGQARPFAEALEAAGRTMGEPDPVVVWESLLCST